MSDAIRLRRLEGMNDARLPIHIWVLTTAHGEAGSTSECYLSERRARQRWLEHVRYYLSTGCTVEATLEYDSNGDGSEPIARVYMDGGSLALSTITLEYCDIR